MGGCWPRWGTATTCNMHMGKFREQCHLAWWFSHILWSLGWEVYAWNGRTQWWYGYMGSKDACDANWAQATHRHDGPWRWGKRLVPERWWIWATKTISGHQWNAGRDCNLQNIGTRRVWGWIWIQTEAGRIPHAWQSNDPSDQCREPQCQWNLDQKYEMATWLHGCKHRGCYKELQKQPQGDYPQSAKCQILGIRTKDNGLDSDLLPTCWWIPSNGCEPTWAYAQTLRILHDG